MVKWLVFVVCSVFVTQVVLTFQFSRYSTHTILMTWRRLTFFGMKPTWNWHSSWTEKCWKRSQKRSKNFIVFGTRMKRPNTKFSHWICRLYVCLRVHYPIRYNFLINRIFLSVHNYEWITFKFFSWSLKRVGTWMLCHNLI